MVDSSINQDEASVCEYTLGFLFSEDKQRIVLIEKQHPEWQKGLLNGVGGKLEPGETALDCMVREFFEETGVYIPNWELFATKGAQLNPRDKGGPWRVHLFRAFSPNISVVEKKALMPYTDEQVIVTGVDAVPLLPTTYALPWEVAMALYSDRVYDLEERVTYVTGN
jgi:8-oxo-dGTP pyrophosphatase MutT (NUDIX family)